MSMNAKRTIAKARPTRLSAATNALLTDIRDLILSARESMATAANATLTLMYWHVGARIRKDILNEKRAEYGDQIVQSLAAQLSVEFGRGFGEKNLRRMVQFAEVFPDEGIVAALLRQLGWTHFTLLIPITDSVKREFYAEMCRVERWSTRTLRQKIQSMLFERTALSRNGLAREACPKRAAVAAPPLVL